MRLALFADIHGNREAFDACLEHAGKQRVDGYGVLGDLVGYGADAQYIVDRVARLIEDGGFALKGNHDEAASLGRTSGMNDYARKAIEWTYENLDKASRELLGALPFEKDEGEYLFVHADASAPSDWRYVTDQASAEQSLRATSKRATFCGHVHVPQLWHMAAGKPATFYQPQTNIAVPLAGARQWLGVLGSTGQPRDKNPAAAWALLDTDRREVIYCRTPYDIEKTASKIHAAGLPQILAARLFVGR
ncbi:MAG: metallophosphoesterase family protein [Alphaproteobacteria bacterium]|nr:metallophosphoesterase family protein [Alphaproteobacteria bacterium]